MQNDLPDGAVLVEVDEDDLASDTAPSIATAESDVQMPLTNNGSHKSAVFERKKEKGRSAQYSLFLYCYYFFLCLQCFDAVGWAAGRASTL